MKLNISSFLVCGLLMIITHQGIAQKWRMSFQPEEPIDFYMAQNDGSVYAMLKSENTQNLFLRVTNSEGVHSRFYFKEESYIQLELPESGYIALISENADKKVQYVYASQRINRLAYSDTEEFFKAAGGVTSKVMLQGQKSPRQPETVAESDGGVANTGEGTTHHMRGITGMQDNDGFDPTRKKDIRKVEKEVAALAEQNMAENMNTAEAARLEEALSANEEYKSKMESLEAKLNKLNQTIDQLQSELEACDGKVRSYESPVYSNKSLVVGLSGGFFNILEKCDECDLEKITGTPTTLEIGVSFNTGKVHKAVMLTAGILPINMTPDSYILDNIFGIKGVMQAKKYGISGAIQMTPDMKYTSGKAGFGLWVMRNTLLMAEVGFVAGDMNLLYTKQVAPSIGLSLIRNFRKLK